MYEDLGFTFCVDRFPDLCAVNIWDGCLQIVPLDAIIDIRLTFILVFAILYGATVVNEFLKGLKGE